MLYNLCCVLVMFLFSIISRYDIKLQKSNQFLFNDTEFGKVYYKMFQMRWTVST